MRRSSSVNNVSTNFIDGKPLRVFETSRIERLSTEEESH